MERLTEMGMYEPKLKDGVEMKQVIENLFWYEEHYSSSHSEHFYKTEPDNSVSDWLETLPSIIKKSPSIVYAEYIEWCNAYGKSAVTKQMFGRSLRKIGIVSKVFTENGKTIRYYLKLA